MDPLSLIRRFEGYRDSPYWDVNAYRVGYGSDTVTLPDGSVVRVTPDLTVTRDMAEADLARRVQTEFTPIAMRSVGSDVWASLGEPQRAALVSVAYNYGRIPDSVAAAVRSGDASAAASAISALGGHNGGVNAKRRAEEARIFAGLPDGGLPTDPQAKFGNALASVMPRENALPRPQQNMLSQGQSIDPANFLSRRRFSALPIVGA